MEARTPLLSLLKVPIVPLAVITGTRIRVVVLLKTLLNRIILSRSVAKAITGTSHSTIVYLSLIILLLLLTTNRLPLRIIPMEATTVASMVAKDLTVTREAERMGRATKVMATRGAVEISEISMINDPIGLFFPIVALYRAEYLYGHSRIPAFTC